MSDSLYIHLQGPGQLSWAVLKPGASRPELVNRGDWQDLPGVTDDTRVTLFVPATEVLLTRINLPGRNRQQQLRAAPYALEEQLIEDVELQHVAVGNGDAQGRTAVAVVARRQLDEWLVQCRQHGIEPDQLLSEAEAVPRGGSEELPGWSLLQMPQRCILHTQQSGYGIDAGNVAMFIERLAADEGKPAALDVIACSAEPLNLPETLTINRQECPGDALVSLIDGARQGNGYINLLQGSYQRKRPLLSGTHRWWPAVAMLVTWVVLEIGIVVNDVWRLSNEETKLRGDAEKIYRAAVPGAKRVVNARAQLQQELDRLHGAGSDDSFLTLLGNAGRLFAQGKDLSLQSISWRDGEMDVSLELTDLQQVDQIKQGLLDQAGLQVDVQSATPKDKVVEARLRIRRQP